jgi:hypothetical protein
MMQITIEVPDSLGSQIQQFQDRLPEVLARGLQELLGDDVGNFMNDREIIAFLANQPTPEQILTIRPSADFQKRVSDLLAQSKAGSLSAKDAAELERYLTIEHLVRLAKANAYGKLQQVA